MIKFKLKRKNLAVLIFTLLLNSVGLFAQQRTIQGTVTDSNGEPIIGASVITKDGKKGVITNIDGKYSINVSENEKVLVFKSVGKQPVEETIKGSTINVVLQDDQKVLDELVVVGYGTV